MKYGQGPMVFSFAGRLHANLDILTERGQELHQPANGKVARAVPH
jgi:hypothetical protein